MRQAEYRVLRPRSIARALADSQRHPSSRYVAGGTDVIANVRHGLRDFDVLIDVRGIPELHGLVFDGDGALRIGGAVTLADLIRDETVRSRYPALATAAESVAAPAHREAATVGGNLCLGTRCVYYNESAWWREANGYCLKFGGTVCHIAPGGTRCWAAYSGDLAPVLIAYGADVEIAGAQGTRRIPLGELYADDGASHLTLRPEEMVVAVRLPAEPWHAAYAKARVRGAIDFPLVGVAVAVRRRDSALHDVRVALTGTDSRPVRIEGTEAFGDMPFDEAAVERLCTLVQKQITPMRTTDLSPFYRRRVAIALVRRLLLSSQA